MEENKSCGCGCGCGCEEELEAELLVFENEDGKEETFEVIGVFEVEEKEYIALQSQEEPDCQTRYGHRHRLHNVFCPRHRPDIQGTQPNQPFTHPLWQLAGRHRSRHVAGTSHWSSHRACSCT